MPHRPLCLRDQNMPMMNKPRKLNIRYNWTDKQFKAFSIFMGVSITLFILAMTLMCILYGNGSY